MELVIVCRLVYPNPYSHWTNNDRMKKNRIIAVHLLNDFSGSPFVLRQSLEALLKKGYEVELLTATPGEAGFLSDIEGVSTYPVFYKWSPNKWMTLLLFLYSQLYLFFKVLFKAHRSDIVYVNSLLPFGAALGARIKGAKVLYHIHEVSIKPAILKKFLLAIADFTASKGIFVSQDLQQRTRFKSNSAVVYNSLPASFIQEAMTAKRKSDSNFSILMICSLKKYKGVDEFVEIARRLPRFTFTLVLNASLPEIDTYFMEMKVPANLELIPSQKNVHPFYQQADVVMNLSRPDEWVETFGMTILEAMYYGKPVIVPPVGGVIELVTPGREGYRISGSQVNEIAEKLQLMATSPTYYRQLSVNAQMKARQFSPAVFSESIVFQIEELRPVSAKHSYSKAVQLGLF